MLPKQNLEHFWITDSLIRNDQEVNDKIQIIWNMFMPLYILNKEYSTLFGVLWIVGGDVYWILLTKFALVFSLFDSPVPDFA